MKYIVLRKSVLIGYGYYKKLEKIDV